jgi:hypothetical protein
VTKKVVGDNFVRFFVRRFNQLISDHPPSAPSKVQLRLYPALHSLPSLRQTMRLAAGQQQRLNSDCEIRNCHSRQQLTQQTGLRNPPSASRPWAQEIRRGLCLRRAIEYSKTRSLHYRNLGPPLFQPHLHACRGHDQAVPFTGLSTVRQHPTAAGRDWWTTKSPHDATRQETSGLQLLPDGSLQ